MQAAFLHHPHSRQTEHLIVDALRDDKALLVSLVGEENGEVVGHIAFSDILIDGQDSGWVGLGPVAARVDRQRQGIGSALVRAGLDEARKLGKQGCVLVGEPDYYRRFGFKADHRLSLEGVPPEYVLALAFDNALVPSGAVAFHKAFAAGL
ncbi:GCN5-related N-acetyltransferase [Rhodospirillaceae bacterium LM-1]|nr:GCN5-related N-acetyltransferase [Rhodospirillaceae bacterium LM-1]